MEEMDTTIMLIWFIIWALYGFPMTSAWFVSLIIVAILTSR